MHGIFKRLNEDAFLNRILRDLLLMPCNSEQSPRILKGQSRMICAIHARRSSYNSGIALDHMRDSLRDGIGIIMHVISVPDISSGDTRVKVGKESIQKTIEERSANFERIQII
jgi:hypothetical protein